MAYQGLLSCCHGVRADGSGFAGRALYGSLLLLAGRGYHSLPSRPLRLRSDPKYVAIRVQLRHVISPPPPTRAPWLRNKLTWYLTSPLPRKEIRLPSPRSVPLPPAPLPLFFFALNEISPRSWIPTSPRQLQWHSHRRGPQTPPPSLTPWVSRARWDGEVGRQGLGGVVRVVGFTVDRVRILGCSAQVSGDEERRGDIASCKY